MSLARHVPRCLFCRPPAFPRRCPYLLYPLVTVPNHQLSRRISMDTMNQYLSNTIGWLRLPVLASSGIAVVLSSLLYFKQKYKTPI